MHIRGIISLILAGTLMPLNGSVPLPPATGMFDLYRQNRTFNIPNQITEDFLLLAYSMISEQAVMDLEINTDLPGMTTFVSRLTASAEKAGDATAVRANRVFLEVLCDLLSEKPTEPSGPSVAHELELIHNAAGLAHSELAGQTIDYSQFRPRGHYTRTPELSRYFQAVRYAGAVLFYAKASNATGIDEKTADRLTEQAILFSRWIRQDEECRKWYEGFEARQSWLFGPPEDLTVDDMLRVADASSGVPPATIRAALLRTARKRGRQPAILSGVVDVSRLEKGVTARDALTGWRLLPGSFTPGAAAAQQLVYPGVGKYLGKAQPESLTTINGQQVKGFPLASEMMSLLGSSEAARLVKESDDSNYQGYNAALPKAGKQLSLPAGLSSEQLGLLRNWFHQTGGSAADRLATARGFWTWTLHGSVLYAKQSYTGIGKGMAPRESRTAAWLEPATSLYIDLRKISAAWEKRTHAAGFQEFSKILDRCIEISAKEKSPGALTPDDVEFLNELDLRLAALTGGADQPIAADFHTDLNSGQVLTEALAYPRSVTHANARGARFQPEEFKQKISERLTDEAWQDLLKKRETQR